MHKTISEENILKIIKRDGVFTLTWRYREDAKRNVCMKLVKRNVLKVKRQAGVDYFRLSAIPI